MFLDLSGLWTSRFHGTLTFLTHAWPTATAYSEDAVSLAPGAGFMLGLHKGGISAALTRRSLGCLWYIVMMGASKPARSEKRHTSASQTTHSTFKRTAAERELDVKSFEPLTPNL